METIKFPLRGYWLDKPQIFTQWSTILKNENFVCYEGVIPKYHESKYIIFKMWSKVCIVFYSLSKKHERNINIH